MASLQAAGRQFLHDHVPEAVAASDALGSVPRSVKMNLAVGLPLRNQKDLDDLLEQLTDPTSPNFRHYLSASEFAERFGPSEEDYQALAAFMQSHGLVVRATHPNRMILDVSGGVTEIEAAFHVNILQYRHASRGFFFAPDREPSLDVGVPVVSVSGLDNFVVPHPMHLQSMPLAAALPLTTGSGPAGLFIGKDFRAAYAPAVTLTGAGQSVGLFELDGFYASDVQANFKQAGLPPVPVKTVLLDGYNGAPGTANTEVILDIMMAAYMAPGLSNIIVYEGYNWNDVLNRMATDNLAAQLSSSWCFSPTNATTEQIFKQMMAQGQSLFQASGDSGAYTGWIMPPADDPNVTVVGGTSLTTAGAGGPWQSETTWSGSGGGFSTVWPIPSYQQSINMAALGGSATMRNIPDVALTADVQMFLIQSNGQAVMVGGTSAAAPLWAGFLALANQQAAANGKPRIGFLNPLLYAIGTGSNFQTDLHDIATGGNGRFSARSGYDLATGWGTPAGQALINQLTGLAGQPAFGLTTSASTLSIAVGASGTTTITVNPQNGFNSAVNLSVSGLPAGVTASFSPASAVTASTLTLTAASSAVPGTSTLTITGTAGSLSNTARLALTLTPPPSFTLSATPGNVSIPQAGTVTSTIAVVSQNGFNGSVALAATGLPTGVTASFSPVASGTSTLTLSATASAAPGASTITVTGTSGSLHSTASIALTVIAPATYTLSASPAAVTVAQGSTITSTITVAPKNGFNGAVTLTATGLPTGVTASFSPASTTGTSTLTLSATASAAPGASTITVTGTSGSQHPSATVSLTVSPSPGYTITASPASLTLLQGGSGASSLTVVPQNGFSGSVTLSVSGLPAGVTATFNPASTTRASTLTFNAAPAAALATATVTVTGTAGTIISKTSITLAVAAPPSFTLSAAPASVNLTPGASGGSTITINPQNGFKDTATFTASGLPSGVTAAFSPASATSTSAVTFTASATAAPSTSTVTITGTSGTLTSKTNLTLTIARPPTFTLSVSPPLLSIPQGAAGSVALTVTPQNGFTGTVTMNVSGLPSGVTAAVTPSLLTLSAASSASVGSSTVTITAKSGSLTQIATLTLTVLPAGAGGAILNLSALFNVPGVVTDGSTFTTGGLDGGGRAYSANLLGTMQTISGTQYLLGPANAPAAVSSAAIPLPPSQLSSLKMLATAVNGNQPAQVFTVTYTDGTTTSFTQSLSDWCTPQSYPGESQALMMSYRNNSNGTRDTRSLLLYGYTLNLSSNKTVKTLALPNNRNVVVLAISLTPAAGNNGAASNVQVNLASVFNSTGLTTDGKTFTGGLDGVGFAYSANLLGATQTYNKTVFNLGPADGPDVVSGNGKAIALPAGNFSALQILATAVNGNQLSQAFKVNYTDGTSTTFTQSLSDWSVAQNFPGESAEVKMVYRNAASGARDNHTFQLYEYSFALNSSKTVSNIVTPNNANVKLLAMTLVP